jgi:hypothetical protein
MLFRKYVLMDGAGAGDGTGAGGGGGNSNTPPDREQFSREYVHELREENKAARLARQEAEKKAAEATDAAKKATDAADAAKKATEQVANDRIIRAELKAEAIKAGVVDLDVLKLVDLSKVTLNDKGEVEGAEALIKAMKESKPHFFGTPNSTEKGGEPPKGGNKQAPKKVGEMTKEERDAEAKKRGFDRF